MSGGRTEEGGTGDRGDGGGGVKVNVTSGGEERGVFDLTNTDSKTLELGPVAASQCHCTVPLANSQGAFPAASPLAPAGRNSPPHRE